MPRSTRLAAAAFLAACGAFLGARAVQRLLGDPLVDPQRLPGMGPQDPVLPTPLGIRCGAGEARTLHSLHLLDLHGTPYEAGREHGRLMREEIGKGVLPTLAFLLDRSWERHTAWVPTARARWTEARWARPWLRNLPPAQLAQLVGIADGAGIDVEIAARALLAKDLLGASWGISPPLLGGLGVVACAESGGALRLVHGRVLDLPVPSPWSAHPTVERRSGSRGGSVLRLGTAGLPSLSALASNEAGLTVSWHPASFSRADSLGIPPFALAQLLVEEARSLAEVRGVLTGRRFSSLATLLVSSAEDGSALAITGGPGISTRVEEMHDNLLVVGDPVFSGPQVGSAGDSCLRRANGARMRRLASLLRRQGGSLEPAGMLAVLGDRKDPYSGSAGVLVPSVCNLFSVTLAAVEGGSGQWSVSMGPQGNLLASLASGGRGREVETCRRAVVGEEERLEKASVLVLSALRALEDGGDPFSARQTLEDARSLLPGDSSLDLLASAWAVGSGDGRGGEDAADEALGAALPPHREALACLWRGRALDAQEQRREAVRAYREALIPGADARVCAAARRGMRVPWKPDGRIAVDPELLWG